MEYGAEGIKAEIAAAAARMVVDDGMEYGPAKRQAVRLLGLPTRTPLPANDIVEEAVLEHIAIFYADSQPQELAALRALAVVWMERLAVYRPYVSASVWRGSATRLSDIVIDLFCDDSKSAEITLINEGIAYQPGTVHGIRGEPVDALSISDFSSLLQTSVAIHLLVYDLDDMRGAMRRDSKGRSPRGDLPALRELLRSTAP